MSITVAKYTFGSWLRKGIGGRINQADNLGSGALTVTERSTVDIDVMINTAKVQKHFALLGPGDIIGINPAMVVRTEPLHRITNFEPNYLPLIEFYDEDFIWRYTPAKAVGDKLRPWLVLIVLKDADAPEQREFTMNDKKIPLPSVTVKSADALPPLTQTWAWSHVHVNEGHNSTNEYEAFLETLHDLDTPNSDKIISRLLCPRKLETGQAYRAFVVPSFETGRLAGLGLDPSTTDAQKPSWADGAANIEFPVYYQWSFHTGENEDFESLVKLLQSRVMDKRLGIRDMNGSAPGFGMTVGTDIGNTVAPHTDMPAIIGLEGALMAPSTKSNPEVIDTSRPFFNQLAAIVNFPEELQKNTAGGADPVVSPPIYGQHHALQNEIQVTNAGWLDALNKDPRNRVPAGFGTNVVQKNQEDYVARAWKQVQKILEANRLIQLASYSMNCAQGITATFTAKLSAEKTLLFFSPLLKKVKGSPTTLKYQMEESLLPTAAVSPAFRRIMRPRGSLLKRMNTRENTFSHTELIQSLNNGRLSAAPPKGQPVDLTTIETISRPATVPTTNPPIRSLFTNNLLESLKKQPKNILILLIVLLLILLLVAFFTGDWLISGLVAAVAAGGAAYINNKKPAAPAENTDSKNPAALVATPQKTTPQTTFRFKETDPVVVPVTSRTTTVTALPKVSSSSPNAVSFTTVTSFTSRGAGQESLEAANFRTASTNLSKRMSIETTEKKYSAFNIKNAYEKLQKATDPRQAFPKLVAAMVNFTFNPDWLLQFENLVPAMAYPDFPDPMYEKLRDISSELLIPNLKLIPQNTISLLVTNPTFIESYMVGLNHEFGRELLWREYPTDERGSYFRQFWDVKGIISNETGLTKEQLTEKYKDIKPIDQWHSLTALGAHNNRNINDKKQVVLVVRGELLKKYPNAIIYAQKAHIYKKDGVADGKKEPIIAQVETAAQMAAEIKFPVFKADVNPDIKFFGFDLTIPQAKGDDHPKLEGDDWGWYFIIQEIPGEPRFGMDITYTPDADKATPITWDDLSWDKYQPAKGFISTTVNPTGFTPAGTGETLSQWGQNGAMMGYILYQKPVMIAIHAKDMLDAIS